MDTGLKACSEKDMLPSDSAPLKMEKKYVKKFSLNYFLILFRLSSESDSLLFSFSIDTNIIYIFH